jgi:hypothetical protein
MIDDDEIEQALTGAADDADEAAAKRARAGTLWLTAPALNSVEYELRAAKLEAETPIDVLFGDDDTPDREHADSETARQSLITTELYNFHISVARSLGSGDHVQWPDYVALCAAEGVEPMPKYHGGRL